ncbi:MAG TPA: phosphate ABC transporter substrate-binding/OmpA family protein [Candidatus Paceibacterota bacterium]|nr:OmpA family protein [Verrucomicrobiota bacterium]HOX03294.1 phosphate ABC transporter substrate-binding/OmpA family protein [Verrucomicrobiota bacterium]HRZ46207.1 phosphate ABC transporter substrate-binding/OmpA family protein [Candidatus Paceibacterota bacterium]HRZ93100.1 phosphate ABC transporter substrate-binding/OmpA family protein [Candidatus Paceibacterota bacterium]
MTARGKVIVTILLLAIVGFGAWRWWDSIAPKSRTEVRSVNVDEVRKAVQAARETPADIPLLIGTNVASLVERSGIPAVTGVSDYAKTMKDGKLVVEFPMNVWPGWAPIIMANAGMEPSDQSVFARKYGFYVRLSVVDDPVKARDLFASGRSHILWGTLDMIALFAPELVKDSRTVPVVCQQIDWSAGGDGIVSRGEIRSINDFRAAGGARKKVVLAQNSPSHYLIMSLLVDAGIDPGDIDFRWAADAPSAAKIFVTDSSFDAFVGWAPDIYMVSEKMPGSRLVVTTGTANHLIADVWAVRNDFFRDHPEIVTGLVRGIFEGMDMVRKDPKNAARALSTAFKIPAEDCEAMVGKDGGITEGDAHLTNYRENAKFFLDPFNPANFEVVWNSASTIYQSLGTISSTVPAAKVKAANILAALAQEYRDVKDLSQPTFKPDALVNLSAEAGPGQVLTKAVMISFEPNKSALNPEYDNTIPATLEEIGKLAGRFGNAYIIIEGNTDASRKGIVPADLVRQLSYDRADAVRRAIMEKYKFDPNKFKVVGNGWDNPMANSTDPSNPEHNKRNRRVEVKVFPLESGS